MGGLHPHQAAPAPHSPAQHLSAAQLGVGRTPSRRGTQCPAVPRAGSHSGAPRVSASIPDRALAPQLSGCSCPAAGLSPLPAVSPPRCPPHSVTHALKRPRSAGSDLLARPRTAMPACLPPAPPRGRGAVAAREGGREGAGGLSALPRPPGPAAAPGGTPGARPPRAWRTKPTALLQGAQPRGAPPAPAPLPPPRGGLSGRGAAAGRAPTCARPGRVKRRGPHPQGSRGAGLSGSRDFCSGFTGKVVAGGGRGHPGGRQVGWGRPARPPLRRRSRAARSSAGTGRPRRCLARGGRDAAAAGLPPGASPPGPGPRSAGGPGPCTAAVPPRGGAAGGEEPGPPPAGPPPLLRAAPPSRAGAAAPAGCSPVSRWGRRGFVCSGLGHIRVPHV